MTVLLVVSYWGPYCAPWGKNKESMTAPCNKVNTMNIIGVHDDPEDRQMKEDMKGKEDEKEATLASMHGQN